MRYFLAAIALSVLAASATAQTPQDADIVVVGQQPSEVAQAFAGAVAVASSSEDQYARWNFRLCPSVIGIDANGAQQLIDHIAQRAQEVGVVAEGEGCRPNLVIVFAPDSDRLARQVYDTRRDLLGYYSEDDVATAGREALEAFVNTPRAVRWWHVARTVTADGQVLSDTRSRVGRGTEDAAAAAQGNLTAAATAGNGFRGVESVRSTGNRFRRNTRQDLSYALIIVDARRITGLPTSAVADYLAMATLVQLDPDADMTPFNSVLNLFNERAPERAALVSMTDWDRAYLQGLYAATREASSSRQQRADIARRMTEQMAAQ